MIKKKKSIKYDRHLEESTSGGPTYVCPCFPTNIKIMTNNNKNVTNGHLLSDFLQTSHQYRFQCQNMMKGKYPVGEVHIFKHFQKNIKKVISVGKLAPTSRLLNTSDSGSYPNIFWKNFTALRSLTI